MRLIALLLAVVLASSVVSAAAKPKKPKAYYTADEVRVLGVREGFQAATARIRSRLDANASRMDVVFRFDVFMRDGLLPPVVEEFGPQVVLGAGGQSRERFEVSFRIASPARFAIAAPTWRDYLYWDGGELAPRVKKVRDADQGVYESAREVGEKQAVEVLRDRLTQLRTDLRGMRFALALMRQRVLAEPQTHKQGDVVRVSESVVLMGLDQVRIEHPAAFVPEDQWGTPEVRPAAGLPIEDGAAQ